MPKHKTPKLDKSEQISTLHRAMAYVKDRTIAIDGGANVGDWTQVMALEFAKVYAFEPHPATFKGLQDRFGEAHNVTLHHAALWNVCEPVTLNPLPDHPNKVRGMFITPGGELPAMTVDSLNLENVGLLKLDCEGADWHALQGAQVTMVKYHPVVIVEVKQSALERFGVKESQIPDLLKGLGATELFRMGPDRIYGWETSSP